MNRLSPEIMKNVFPLNNKISYNIKNRRIFYSRLIRSVTYGSETLSQLVPDHWELIPTLRAYMKSLQSVASFKSAFKKWKPSDNPCRLYHTVYLSGWLRE